MMLQSGNCSRPDSVVMDIQDPESRSNQSRLNMRRILLAYAVSRCRDFLYYLATTFGVEPQLTLCYLALPQHFLSPILRELGRMGVAGITSEHLIDDFGEIIVLRVGCCRTPVEDWSRRL